MKLFTLTVAVVALLGTGLLALQDRPSFAGRWTTDPEPSAAPAQAARGQQPGPARGGRGDMGSGWGSTITITQDLKSLTVEYAFFGRGDMQPPMKFVFALDGTETKNSVMMGRGIQAQTSHTAWTGTTLAITTLHTLADPATGKPTTTEVVQKLTLESPTSLVVETTRAGVAGGPASTTRTVYRKVG